MRVNRFVEAGIQIAEHDFTDPGTPEESKFSLRIEKHEKGSSAVSHITRATVTRDMGKIWMDLAASMVKPCEGRAQWDGENILEVLYANGDVTRYTLYQSGQ